MLDGVTVIPTGKPVGCTVTEEENPSIGVASNDTETELPAVNETWDGVTDKLKSPPPPPPPLPPPPPPQPVSPARTRTARVRKSARRRKFEDECTIKGTRFLWALNLKAYGFVSIGHGRFIVILPFCV